MRTNNHFRRHRPVSSFRRAFAVFVLGPTPENGADVWEVYIGDRNARPNTPVQRCYSHSEAHRQAYQLSKHYSVRRILINECAEMAPTGRIYDLKPFRPQPSLRRSGPIRIGDYVRFEDIMCRVTAVTPDTVTLYVAHPPRELLDIRANVFLAYFEPKTVTIPRTPDLEILNR